MLNLNKQLKTRGFTLIELLVVIAVIGILSTIVMFSLSGAKSSSRDKIRAADLESIRVAVRLYAEDKGHYPCDVAANCAEQNQSATGRIGEGSYIDTLLSPYMAQIPGDPQGPGDSDYYYYLDARQTCGGNPNKIVIFANTMETDRYKNSTSTVCTSWGGENGAGNTDSYMIVIGNSTDG